MYLSGNKVFNRTSADVLNFRIESWLNISDIRLSPIHYMHVFEIFAEQYQLSTACMYFDRFFLQYFLIRHSPIHCMHVFHTFLQYFLITFLPFFSQF